MSSRFASACDNGVGAPNRAISRLDGSSFGELLAKQPDRSHVGNPVGERQAKEAQDMRSLMRYSALAGEIVHRPDDEDLEHHHRIEERLPTSRAIGIAERRYDAEHLEIDRRQDQLQMVPKPAQPLL